jgi:hypothetical protein
MRLHPEVSEDEAYDWLKEQVERDDPNDWSEELEQNLQMFARAMASISRVVLPDDLEPLFP